MFKTLVATGAALAVFALPATALADVKDSFVIDPPAADQVVLTGTCFSAAEIVLAAEQALNVYYTTNGPGEQPAGVWLVNPGPVQAGANWVPADLALGIANQLQFCLS